MSTPLSLLSSLAPEMRRDAQDFLSHVLGVKRLELFLCHDMPLSPSEIETFQQLIERRKEGEPVGYLLGEVDFYHCRIRVDRRVLIPRPETEQLVDLVVRSRPFGTLVDLCTGSGCIAIALKKQFPSLRVIGVDVSEGALEVARENAILNGVDVEWRQGDFLDAVKDVSIDWVVSNPPYVTEGEWEGLDRSVKQFEPKLALVGGLAFYERLAEKRQQKLFLEIGSSQGPSVQRLFPGSKLTRDWSGRDRFISLE